MSNIIQVSQQFDPSSVVFTKMKKNKNGEKPCISMHKMAKGNSIYNFRLCDHRLV